MTVYVSRYAATGELTLDRAGEVSALTRPGSADPPLLTHVWRIVFERQARRATVDER
ncbi:multiple cyclophane-containing RiPP AmcA [Micromonospora sp. NPDC050686]|uniref:multiple cyclophane-containing RiPP AmcA n=1 Tax=Micromonospora sp. NPDC050686 TaxID=3154631 RepID=UPI00340E762C